jgi:hypothetical protein
VRSKAGESGFNVGKAGFGHEIVVSDIGRSGRPVVVGVAAGRFDSDALQLSEGAHPGHRIARRGLVRIFQLTRIFRYERSLQYDDRRATSGLRKPSSTRLQREKRRALMAEPRLILLDEPMAGMNRALGGSLLDEVERLRREGGMTFLFIEHDIDIVMKRADHVIARAEGADPFARKGSPLSVLPQLRRCVDVRAGQTAICRTMGVDLPVRAMEQAQPDQVLANRNKAICSAFTRFQGAKRVHPNGGRI